MKKKLKTLAVFQRFLKVYAWFAHRNYLNFITRWLTTTMANFNISLNHPKKSNNLKELAYTWKKLMPADAQHLFKVKSINENTAITEIHIHCPLRGTGNTKACYKLMNYDRQLLKKIGGQLVVLESQSSAEQTFCKLAIRKAGVDISDLKPAHLPD